MRFIRISGGDLSPPRKGVRVALAALLALTLLASMATTAKAESVEITFIGTLANTGNPLLTDFYYTATLTPNNYVSTNDRVMFYDFDGFVSGTFIPDPLLGGPSYGAPVYSDAAAGPIGPFGAETLPTGDLTIGDVVFSYNGVSPYLSLGGSAPGDPLIGTFILTSTFKTAAIDVVQTEDTSVGADLTIGGTDDRANLVTRNTTVARDNGFTPPSVPLPLPAVGAAALMGLVAMRRGAGTLRAV